MNGFFTGFPPARDWFYGVRTFDYLFHSPKLQRIEGYVRQEDTLTISDHLPVLGRLLLPAD